MSERPNILYILTDDQGWDDLSLHGNPILETPHLDALAKESVQFADFQVAAVCAPTRAALLTGRHFLRTGVSHVHGGKDFVHRSETLLGEYFQAAGYHTGMWGKWHSGKAEGYFPWQRGFDEAYMAKLYKHRDSHGLGNGTARQYSGWTTDIITDLCIDFIQGHRDRPFFAFLPHLSPHAPLAAPDELIAKYKAKRCSHHLATLYAMIEQIDRATGRLLAALDRLGLRENTIVVFHSDNGPAINSETLDETDRALRLYSGYKGHKGDMWQNGIKSPLFIRWPARFRPRTVQRLCDVCDLLPTLLDCCGIDRPTDHLPLDGRSIRSYCEGDETTLPAKESMLWIHPGWIPAPDRPYDPMGIPGEYRPVPPEEKAQLVAEAECLGIRTEDWKLMRHPGWQPGRPEEIDGRVLIHIAEDRFEDRNLLAQESERAQDLEHRALDWFESIKREPHSLTAPCFRIDRARNDIPSSGTCCITGHLRNTVSGLHAWGHGGGADYRLYAAEGGHCQLRLKLPTPHAAFTLHLSLGGHEERLVVPADSVEICSEALALDKGEQLLHLELHGPTDDKTVLLPHLPSLTIERRRDSPASP